MGAWGTSSKAKIMILSDCDPPVILGRIETCNSSSPVQDCAVMMVSDLSVEPQSTNSSC